jgi:hypothetical protein
VHQVGFYYIDLNLALVVTVLSRGEQLQIAFRYLVVANIAVYNEMTIYFIY